jgi:hypothetical protein
MPSRDRQEAAPPINHMPVRTLLKKLPRFADEAAVIR